VFSTRARRIGQWGGA